LNEAAAQRLTQRAREQPLSVPELLQRHTAAKGEPVHIDIRIRYLLKGGLVWKRTRHSLKKRELPPLAERSRQEIEALRERAQAGEIDLAHFDEAGIKQVHRNRSAWTVGVEQQCIEAPRSERLNVMAALFNKGSVIRICSPPSGLTKWQSDPPPAPPQA
jgi:hypothetical protein